MKWVSYLFYTLAILLVIATLLPLLPLEEWFIRIFDFPRVQIAAMILAVLAVFVVKYRTYLKGKVVIFLLVASVVYQLVRILPYTPLYPTLAAKGDAEEGKTIKILVANVLMSNDDYGKFEALINKEKPDIYLTLESDSVWQAEILQKLDQAYPYDVKVPQNNTYGMHLYSRLPLFQTEVKYWLDKEIPSIRTLLTLDSGDTILFHGVHPKPPVPGEDDDSRQRDAEIMIVGNRVADAQYPVIVAGDFNDVAWSPTTRLFLEVSGLLDPRIGRGFYNTYSARSFFFRWPLDHFFYSTDFKLVNIRRLSDINSDHFPISIHLSYQPQARAIQDPIPPDEDTQEEETETIKEGLKDATKESD